MLGREEHPVKVKRIVSNVVGSDVEKARAFYKEILGPRFSPALFAELWQGNGDVPAVLRS